MTKDQIPNCKTDPQIYFVNEKYVEVAFGDSFAGFGQDLWFPGRVGEPLVTDTLLRQVVRKRVCGKLGDMLALYRVLSYYRDMTLSQEC